MKNKEVEARLNKPSRSHIIEKKGVKRDMDDSNATKGEIFYLESLW